MRINYASAGTHTRDDVKRWTAHTEEGEYVGTGMVWYSKDVHVYRAYADEMTSVDGAYDLASLPVMASEHGQVFAVQAVIELHTETLEDAMRRLEGLTTRARYAAGDHNRQDLDEALAGIPDATQRVELAAARARL